MNNVFLAMLGWPEIMGILVVVLILFGAKKLPELARGLGSGIKEFKKATQDVQDDLHRALDDDHYDPPRRAPQRPRSADDAPPEPKPDSSGEESGSKSE